MTPDKPGLKGWGGLATLALLWGGAFAFITVGVETLPPSLVAFGRLALAAVVLTVWAGLQRRYLPPLGDRRWLWFAGLGLFGNTLPFTLIAIGQQTVPSGVAGILMGMTPLAIIMAAHFVLPGERINAWKAAGFLIGFSGIVLLTGPSALAGMLETDFLAQMLIFAATLAYAANAIMYQRMPETAPIIVAAGSLICASVLAAPLVIWDLAAGAPIAPSFASILAVIALGLLPTALATIVYMGIARKVGAAFIALINYAVPVVAALIGLMLGEALGLTAWLALGVILLGIFIARQGSKPRKRAD
ncbi:EamA family transporter [Alkalicaulis satelles]|uniref:EamA family transporter n=1 Tax=Alkalicaulis satelles TaxID=2609175 RepID=A0A5M6ZHV7_9PROT|nr:EamA family transporter [Alkalicaulis satelles]KAA5803384.1 EamA family transporter [Alkalicaulis satelles]